MNIHAPPKRTISPNATTWGNRHFEKGASRLFVSSTANAARRLFVVTAEGLQQLFLLLYSQWIMHVVIVLIQYSRWGKTSGVNSDYATTLQGCMEATLADCPTKGSNEFFLFLIHSLKPLICQVITGRRHRRDPCHSANALESGTPSVKTRCESPVMTFLRTKDFRTLRAVSVTGGKVT